jgi:hypothetical protein
VAVLAAGAPTVWSRRFVTPSDDLLVAAGPSAEPGRWLSIFDELMSTVAGRFSRVETRWRPRAFVLGRWMPRLPPGCQGYGWAGSVAFFDFRTFALLLAPRSNSSATSLTTKDGSSQGASRNPASRRHALTPEG